MELILTIKFIPYSEKVAQTLDGQQRLKVRVKSAPEKNRASVKAIDNRRYSMVHRTLVEHNGLFSRRKLMPYFTWQGITIVAKMKRGRLFARDKKELQSILFKRNIALITSKEQPPWFQKKIGMEAKILFFEQLSCLLSAGILLPEALHLLALQLDNNRLQEAAHTIADAVHAGKTFHEALADHSALFTPLMIHMAHIGQETGRLASSCLVLCTYLRMIASFKKSVRQATLMPIITGTFFIIIALIILVGIMPFFASLFSSMKADLPRPTTFLLYLSKHLTSVTLASIALGIIATIGAIRLFARSSYGRSLIDTVSIQIPIIGTLMHDRARAHITRSLSVLIHAGVPLPTALHIAAHSEGNTVLHQYARYLEYAVHSGDSLSQAFMQHPEQWFEQSIGALVRIGEESGTLANALAAIADHYNQNIERNLQWYSTLVQPILVLLLGILIAFFICAVYMPLFNLAQVL